MSEKFGNAFSEKFCIPEGYLKSKGIFDPTLDVDSPLFIDPFLLAHSKHKEFSECAFETYEQHFTEIYRLLQLSEKDDDKAWQGALRKFKFSEAKGLGGTCLGYSKTTKGRGFGVKLSRQALHWAQQVIHLGVKDPELFSSMFLFEQKIGADLISDMVTNITLSCILSFNDRLYRELEAETGIKPVRSEVVLRGLKANLPINPYSNDGSPIILLPDDILKHLPVSNDARQIAHVAEANANLRDRVNSHISEIFKIANKKDKEATKARAMKDAEAFQTLLDLLKILENRPYDIYKDPEGLVQWRPLAQYFSAANKFELHDNPKLSRLDRIDHIVEQVVDQYRHLIEDARMWRVFYVDHKPRHERFAQLLFLSIAKSYCDANGIDMSPESDGGAGPVDFKFSDGAEKVVVEIKLSTNQNVVQGYEKQLQAYMSAERSERGHYVVINVGKMGKKWERLRSLAAAEAGFASVKKIYLIDGRWRESASNL